MRNRKTKRKLSRANNRISAVCEDNSHSPWRSRKRQLNNRHWHEASARGCRAQCGAIIFKMMRILMRFNYCFNQAKSLTHKNGFPHRNARIHQIAEGSQRAKSFDTRDSAIMMRVMSVWKRRRNFIENLHDNEIVKPTLELMRCWHVCDGFADPLIQFNSTLTYWNDHCFKLYIFAVSWFWFAV